MADYIYSSKNTNYPDQHVTNYIIENGGKGAISVGLFDKYEFPNGLLFFDKEDLIPLSKEHENVKTLYNKNTTKTTAFVHANWMVGINNKIAAFKKKMLWYTF
jgi:hypothetical protein